MYELFIGDVSVHILGLLPETGVKSSTFFGEIVGFKDEEMGFCSSLKVMAMRLMLR